MKKTVHRIAALAATLTIAAFLLSSVVVESFASPAAVVALKAFIVFPGLFVLVPALALAGASGFALARLRGGRLADAKKRRMPIIAGNGLLVLVPCALLLDRWAAAGQIDAGFYAIQGLELAAGALNLFLMLLNIRDGLRLSGRFSACAAAARATASPR
jgi:hypothetical protein